MTFCFFSVARASDNWPSEFRITRAIFHRPSFWCRRKLSLIWRLPFFFFTAVSKDWNEFGFSEDCVIILNGWLIGTCKSALFYDQFQCSVKVLSPLGGFGLWCQMAHKLANSSPSKSNETPVGWDPQKIVVLGVASFSLCWIIVIYANEDATSSAIHEIPG